MTTIQLIFDKLLDDLNKIPHVERNLLHDLFRKHQPQSSRESYLKAPLRNKDKDNTYKSKHNADFDENEWIDNLFTQITQDAQNAIAPLEEYLKKFEPFRHILKIIPEEYAKEFDDEERPKEVELIRDTIKENFQKERKLRQEMPESV